MQPPKHNSQPDTADRNGLTECPACGAATPAENLNCIYCGELLPVPVGFLSSLSAGWKGLVGLVVTVVILIAFLCWIL